MYHELQMKTGFSLISKKTILIVADGNTTTATFGCQYFFLSDPLGVDIEIDACSCLQYPVGGRVDSSSDQILPQLRHRKWAVGIATALET